jgi:hypothetical protein
MTIRLFKISRRVYGADLCLVHTQNIWCRSKKSNCNKAADYNLKSEKKPTLETIVRWSGICLIFKQHLSFVWFISYLQWWIKRILYVSFLRFTVSLPHSVFCTLQHALIWGNEIQYVLHYCMLQMKFQISWTSLPIFVFKIYGICAKFDVRMRNVVT